MEYKQEYMVPGYSSSPDLRGSAMDTSNQAGLTDLRNASISSDMRQSNEMSCSTFTPSISSTSPPAPGTIFSAVPQTGVGNSGFPHALTGGASGQGVNGATASPGAPSGYQHYFPGSYYPSSGTGNLGQGSLGNSTTVALLHHPIYQQQPQLLFDRQDQYQRQDCRDLSVEPMVEDPSRYISDRSGVHSPNDLSVWRPY